MPLGLHPFELIILVGVVLLMFAPKKLPQISSGIAKSIRDFKKELSSHKTKELE
jgi:TatA/E family protein of Tat protein translocase